MKLILLLLFLLAWTMIVAGYVQSYAQCPPSKTEYRYIPRSIIEEQLSSKNTKVGEIYEKMRTYRDPLV